ncbi:hypothetical protein ES708_29229 [subsurface metagenome]
MAGERTGDGIAACMGMSEAEFEQHRQAEISALFMPPAKQGGSGKSAIPAQNRQLCGKKAEDIYLQRHQAAGSDRYFGRRKSAIPAQDRRF